MLSKSRLSTSFLCLFASLALPLSAGAQQGSDDVDLTRLPARGMEKAAQCYIIRSLRLQGKISSNESKSFQKSAGCNEESVKNFMARLEAAIDDDLNSVSELPTSPALEYLFAVCMAIDAKSRTSAIASNKTFSEIVGTLFQEMKCEAKDIGDLRGIARAKLLAKHDANVKAAKEAGKPAEAARSDTSKVVSTLLISVPESAPDSDLASNPTSASTVDDPIIQGYRNRADVQKSLLDKKQEFEKQSSEHYDAAYVAHDSVNAYKRKIKSAQSNELRDKLFDHLDEFWNELKTKNCISYKDGVIDNFAVDQSWASEACDPIAEKLVAGLVTLNSSSDDFDEYTGFRSLADLSEDQCNGEEHSDMWRQETQAYTPKICELIKASLKNP